MVEMTTALGGITLASELVCNNLLWFVNSSPAAPRTQDIPV
jgi:hypothetical protein